MGKSTPSRGTGLSRSASAPSRSSAPRSSSNSRMWSQPATSRQISALKAHGNFDGKFYSKGRAGQAIGESIRAAGSASSIQAMQRGGGRAGAGPQPTQIPTGGPAAPPPNGPSGSTPLHGEITPPSAPTPYLQEQPVPVDIHAGEEHSEGLSFALFNELEERHLRAFQAEHSSNWGAQLRDEAHEWGKRRIARARRWGEAHAALVAILGEAPPGALPDPAATAWALLASASPYGIEERHLRLFLSEHSSNWGSQLRDEIAAWEKSRIRQAKTSAHGMVAMLRAQAALAPAAAPPALPTGPGPKTTPTGNGDEPPQPKQPRNRTLPPSRAGKGRTYLATVVRINPHGAVVSLEGGEQGWLHVSHLRKLNGGAHVESVSDVLKVGQQLRTSGIGTTDRGQVRLALVDAGAAKHQASDGPAAPPELASAAKLPTPVKRGGLLGRLALGRPPKEQP